MIVMTGSANQTRGFTLLEVLVVVSLILGLSALLVAALRPEQSNLSIAASQRTLLALIQGTRAHAALAAGEAALFLRIDPTSPHALRELRIGVSETSPADAWQWSGERVLLPSGTFVFPAAAWLSAEAVVSADWPPAWCSEILDAAPPTPTGFAQIVCYDGQGALRSAPGFVVVAGARRSAESLIFEQPLAARAVQVTRYGSWRAVNDLRELNR